MRKAFDANVSRSKPRLRLGSLATAVVDPAQDALAEPAKQAQALVEHATLNAAKAEPVAAAPVAQVVERVVPTVQEKIAAQLASPPPAPAPAAVAKVEAPVVAKSEPKPKAAQVAASSQERREKLRERLKAASAKVEPSQPTPQSPAEARTSALALISQLRQELEDAQKLNVALTRDLDQSRTELSRSAEEARARTFEAARMANEVAERARLIEELGKEMASLESERDDTMVELSNSRAEREKQTVARQELESKLAVREAELTETLTEEERLAAELEARNVELRSAQTALAAVTDERDKLARQVVDLTRDRADLLDSQKALDEIHRALADARVRVGTKL